MLDRVEGGRIDGTWAPRHAEWLSGSHVRSAVRALSGGRCTMHDFTGNRLLNGHRRDEHGCSGQTCCTVR